MGMRIYSDVAIDDFSMSPECFGLNMPAEHLDDYNYYDPRILQDKLPHYDFINHTGICQFPTNILTTINSIFNAITFVSFVSR